MAQRPTNLPRQAYRISDYAALDNLLAAYTLCSVACSYLTQKSTLCTAVMYKVYSIQSVAGQETHAKRQISQICNTNKPNL